jgi:hypothetical protein
LLKGVISLDKGYGGLYEQPEDNKRKDAGITRNDIRRSFYDYWGWEATIDEITMGQPWLEDEIYNWNVVRFLNKLAYMKDKNELEQSINRLAAGNR